MVEIDRIAIILRPREAMLQWIRTLPEPELKELTLEDIYQDCTVLLLPICDEEDEIWEIIESNYMNILTNELSAWVDDESLWPAQIHFALFKEWIDIEPHGIVFDLASDGDNYVYN